MFHRLVLEVNKQREIIRTH